MKAIVSCILLAAAVPAFADTISINLDGNGTANGTPLTFSLSPDPGPGGLPDVLTYTLPFNTTQGDVLVFDPNLGFPGFVLRFNGNGTVAVYAVNTSNSLAATPNPPSSLYPNTIVISATGTEADLMATFTPSSADPGFNASAAPTYILDAVPIPEPSTMSLMAIALAGFVAYRIKRHCAGPQISSLGRGRLSTDSD